MHPYWVRGSTTMITAIHTAVKGRARYKVTGLHGSGSLKRLLEVRLVAHAEIQEVSASTLTGNILVRYRPDLSPAAVASLLADVMTDYEDTVRRRNGAPTEDLRPQRPAADTPAGSRRAVRRAVTHGKEQDRAHWHLMEAVVIALPSHPCGYRPHLAGRLVLSHSRVGIASADATATLLHIATYLEEDIPALPYIRDGRLHISVDTRMKAAYVTVAWRELP